LKTKEQKVRVDSRFSGVLVLCVRLTRETGAFQTKSLFCQLDIRSALINQLINKSIINYKQFLSRIFAAVAIRSQ